MLSLVTKCLIINTVVISSLTASASSLACWQINSISSLPPTNAKDFSWTCNSGDRCWQVVKTDPITKSKLISLGCGGCSNATLAHSTQSNESCFECGTNSCNGEHLQSQVSIGGYERMSARVGQVNHMNYIGGSQFKWILTSPNNTVFKLRFTKLLINFGFESLSIYQRTMTDKNAMALHKVDQNDAENSTFVAVSPVLITFTASSHVIGSGFEFAFESVITHPNLAVETIDSKSGSRSSHIEFGSRAYPTQHSRLWIIKSAPNEVIQLQFTHFQLCSLGDYVTVSFQYLSLPTNRMDFTSTSVNVTDRRIVSFSNIYLHFAAGSGSGWLANCTGGFQFKFATSKSGISVKSPSKRDSLNEWSLQFHNIPSDSVVKCSRVQCSDNKLVNTEVVHKHVRSLHDTAFSQRHRIETVLHRTQKFKCDVTSPANEDFVVQHQFTHSQSKPTSGQINVRNHPEWSRSNPIFFTFTSPACCVESVIHNCFVTHSDGVILHPVYLQTRVTSYCGEISEGSVTSYFSVNAVETRNASVACELQDGKLAIIYLPSTEDWQNSFYNFPSLAVGVTFICTLVCCVLLAVVFWYSYGKRRVRVSSNNSGFDPVGAETVVVNNSDIDQDGVDAVGDNYNDIEPDGSGPAPNALMMLTFSNIGASSSSDV